MRETSIFEFFWERSLSVMLALKAVDRKARGINSGPFGIKALKAFYKKVTGSEIVFTTVPVK